MCGIIALLSLEKNILNDLLQGLYQLKNRGYDSAIISIINKGNIITEIP